MKPTNVVVFPGADPPPEAANEELQAAAPDRPRFAVRMGRRLWGLARFLLVLPLVLLRGPIMIVARVTMFASSVMLLAIYAGAIRPELAAQIDYKMWGALIVSAIVWLFYDEVLDLFAPRG